MRTGGRAGSNRCPDGQAGAPRGVPASGTGCAGPGAVRDRRGQRPVRGRARPVTARCCGARPTWPTPGAASPRSRCRSGWQVAAASCCVRLSTRHWPGGWPVTGRDRDTEVALPPVGATHRTDRPGGAIAAPAKVSAPDDAVSTRLPHTNPRQFVVFARVDTSGDRCTRRPTIAWPRNAGSMSPCHDRPPVITSPITIANRSTRCSGGSSDGRPHRRGYVTPLGHHLRDRHQQPRPLRRADLVTGSCAIPLAPVDE